MPEFVDVAVPLGVRKTFAYSVPKEFGGSICTGMRVLVPFGRKLLTGIVVGHPSEPPAGFRIRPIRDLIDAHAIVPGDLIQAAMWVASYYFTAPGEALRALFPAGAQVTGEERVKLSSKSGTLLEGGLRPIGLSSQEEALLEILRREGAMKLKDLKSRSGLRDIGRWVGSLAEGKWVDLEEQLQQSRVREKERLGIRALGVSADETGTLTAAQQRLYGLLVPGAPPVPLQDILRRCSSSASVAQLLERKGLVEISPMAIQRTPLDLTEVPARKMITLTQSQNQVFEAVREMILSRRPERCLLHGVTGSGKTEIYLRLIAEVLGLDGTAILMVPEIGLTPLLSRIAVSHFPDKVALLHSGMSPGERHDQWQRIRSGQAPVVVGTRSAVFAPLENLRLVVIDEEQDPSYKQDETPSYHAREVAWFRMLQSHGVLLMGSATPSIETFHAAKERCSVKYFQLPERVEARPLPDVTIVDMSLEFQRHGRKTILAQTLLDELRERLLRGEQSMILLNRRGYSRSLLCRSCGHTIGCRECSIPMTYHQDQNRLLCHYCGAEESVPSACVNCGGEYIYFVGVGTEQLEEVLRKLLPGARLARLDRDTTRRRGVLRKTLLDFSDGRLDVLVGTQILAKGHDFPNVTLVGVIAADAGLQFPDFRSAERTFQLLTQVAGRAGRGETRGRVIIQSFYPEHYALRFARKQDYAGFYLQEVEFRKLLGYPPFTELVQILVSEESASKAFTVAGKIASALKMFAPQGGPDQKVRVLGPAAAPLERLRGKYRVQVLLKVYPGGDRLGVLDQAFRYAGEHRVPLRNVSVDVDPLSLL